MTVVVSGYLRVVPVGYLVGEYLRYRLAGQAQVPDLLAVVADLVGKRGAACRDRQVRIRPALGGVRNPRHRVHALVADGGDGKVRGAGREVLPPLGVAIGGVHDLDAF